ncbi:MAG TPA: DUF4124 domain-containing protein [Steroidobacteraceae bacterium]|nr:DUF4124 domain-containing protein [Steroidobacteraceae bacterium]
MHLWRTLIALGIFVACACPAASPIYKWTDAAGVVHYADHPGPGAHKVTVNVDVVPASAGQPPSGSAAAARRSRGGSASDPYTQFVIDSPTGEQSFFTQPVPVHLTMQPALQTDHALTWTLNGKILATHANQIEFTLDLPRGAFTLTATVADQATGATLNSTSVTFYEHRPSLLDRYHHPR